MSESEFIIILERHQNIIHKICRIYCANDDTYEDLFQEITFQLWKARNSFKGEAKISTWIYRIGLYTALSEIRKYKRRNHAKQQLYTENVADENDDGYINELYKAIGKLNKIEKALVTLYLDNKSYAEMSAIIGISESNVGARLTRLKKKLKHIMQVNGNR